MPIVTKTKTHSKCRAWEQERRKRLGIAFSNLAAVLPTQDENVSSSTAKSSAAPNTKILILQHSLHYIQQLQAKCGVNTVSDKGSKVDVGVETDEIEEVRILKAKCWELVNILVQAKLPLPAPPSTSITPSHKYLHAKDSKKTDVKNSTNESNTSLCGKNTWIGDKNVSESITSKEPVKITEPEVILCNDGSDGEKGNEDDCHNDGNGAKGRKRKAEESVDNLLSDNDKDVEKNSKKKRCGKKKLNNINRKHTRKKVKVLQQSNGLPFIHSINNTSNLWVTNAALKGPVVLPLLPPLLPPAPPTILINPFPFPLLTTPRKLVNGFDITKTTMVNKVPIPTTTLAMVKKKSNEGNVKKLAKVTFRSRLKMMKAINAMKGDSKNDKAKKTEETGNSSSDVGKVTEVNQNNMKQKTDKTATTVSTDSNSKTKSENVSTSSDKIQVKDDNNKDAIENNKVDAKTVENQQETSQVNNANPNVVKGNENNLETSKDMEVSSSVEQTKQIPVSIAQVNNSSKGVDVSKAVEDSEKDGSKKRKVDEGVVESVRQDITGDMGEELSLPSPTAAFLLTFPLVCSGPSEQIQPPQDNFSNFFTTRDTSVSTANQNVFMPNNDCLMTKPLASVTVTPNVVSYSKISTDTRPHVSAERNTISAKDQSKDNIPTSSACVFSESQNIFPPISIYNNNYSFSESIFNYEHAPVSGNIKPTKSYTQNTKVSFNVDNLHSNNKQMSNNTMYTTASHNSVNNNINSTFLYNNDNDNKSSSSMSFPNNTKKTYDNSCKLFFSSHSTTATKSDSIQSKAIFSNASTIYTSTNSYNPFDLPITPTTFSVANTVANNNSKSKSSNMYFPDFSTNIYTQSCNLWMDESNGFGGEYVKGDGAKRPSNSTNAMQNYPLLAMDSQPDFRYPSTPSKHTNIQNNNKNSTSTQSSSKNVKTTGKISVKDTKYLVQDNKDSKADYVLHKGPINWMTSEVNFASNNQDVFSNNNQKDLRNNVLQGTTNHCIIDPSLPITGFPSTVSSKKGEMYDAPLYMPSGGFMSQNFNEDNQFTWSPSKLMPLADSTPLVPSSLPTLVGDLALSMGEAKQTYQHLFLEQPDNAVSKGNEKKNMQHKNKTPVKANNNKVQCEINPSNAGSFLSVSQLMERGKEENVYQDNSANNKSNLHYNQSRNIHLSNINKSADVPMFSTEVFGVQQMSDYFPTPLPKVQKNTYSTESLLQSNDDHYVSGNKVKHASKSYEASNLCISSNINANQQMEFDNFSHTNFTNSYCYPSTVNTPLYTSSNYLGSGGPNSASFSCVNSTYMPDTNDCSTTMDNNYYTKMDGCLPLDIPKYNIDINKNSNNLMKHHKSENMKKDVLMKRQRKNKIGSNDSYSTSNTCCIDDSVYGYQMSMGTYPTHKGQNVKPGATSPNHSGTSSLANFNLSTIFPEINKRPSMPGYPSSDTSHKPSMSLYL